MRRPHVPVSVALLVAAAVLLAASGCRHTAPANVGASSASTATASLPAPPAPVLPPLEHATVPARSTFSAALSPFHLDAGLVRDWVRAARPVYNLAHIQAGRELTLERSATGAPLALTYQINDNHALKIAAATLAANHAAPGQAAWIASITTIPYVTKLEGASGSVQSSLFQAVEDAGEQDALALKLADIFGWDLDFYTDTQAGDQFRVLVEKKYLNGKFSGYGQIVAAEYVNAGTPYDALRFHDDLGMLAYYRTDGKPMKREFLRSPLKFAARISSGFSRHRFHPILKIYRAHLGTDFAAPIGTPVQSIGAGIVIFAARKGGDGNMVKIRHAGDYDTLYLHLSRILVHVGQRVAQGQRIGLVGMTGLATGPHLDFRIEHDGNFENFEVLRKKLPPAAPVTPKLLAQFDALKAKYMPELKALEPHQATAAAAGK